MIYYCVVANLIYRMSMYSSTLLCGIGLRSLKISRVFGSDLLLDNEATNSKKVADFVDDAVDKRRILNGRNEQERIDNGVGVKVDRAANVKKMSDD